MNSLSELKKIIQSMNDSITDDIIGAFQKELSQLEQQYGTTPVVNSFLKMMHSLGNYLGSKKNNAHADAMPVLNSIAEQLDNFITHPDLEQEEINRITAGALREYKSLQNKIASGSTITDNELNDLKEAILAIDWEISDTNLKNFETVVTRLLPKSKNYKIQHTFLKIIHTTGRYISTRKADAPADSTSFLRSVFENFEKIILTPGMLLEDKKRLLEADIQRFHEMKHKFSAQKTETDSTPDDSEAEFLQPALSHIRSTSTGATENIIPLVTLPEQEGNLPAGNGPKSDAITQAQSDRRMSLSGSRDVMDDLFSIKESPADELLDAIHLMDVNESNPDQVLNMIERTNDLKSDGIKNFTPLKMDTEPIPEIGTRLDEFFNLDISEDSDAAPEDNEVQTIELSSFESEGAFEILSRLKSIFETPGWLKNESSMTSIMQDMSLLESSWQTNPEKTSLMEIISSLVTQLKNQQKTDEPDEFKNEITAHATVKDAPDIPREKPKGVWGKIKGMFTS